MSVTSTHVSASENYDCNVFSLSDTSETTVLTAVDGFDRLLTEIWIADDGGAARTVTLQITRGGTQVVLGASLAVAANTPLVYPFNGAILKKTSANTDILTLTGSASGIEGYVGYIGIRSEA